MKILDKLRRILMSKVEAGVSHLVEKNRIDFRSFAPVYGKNGHIATVGSLTHACDVIGTDGKVIGQTEKVTRMYKPSSRSILGRMNVYEVTTSRSPYGNVFEGASIRKPQKTGKGVEFETITSREEFKGYIKAMKMNSGAMKV